jgi:predicted nuclease of predicted toxin-antitoxin system
VKLLIDVSVGQAVVDALARAGWDVQAVRDRDASMSDQQILQWAVADDRVVITMDKDFGQLVFQAGWSHRGVLLMRLEGASSTEKIAAVTAVLLHAGDQLVGRFAVYQDGRLRMRK